MKFLIDAQLPVRLAVFLSSRGHDAVHVCSLPDGYQTTDAAIASTADAEGRVVVSKDSDFRHSHFAGGIPAHLLIIRVGNTSNNDLITLLEARLEQITTALSNTTLVELRREMLVLHPARQE